MPMFTAEVNVPMGMFRLARRMRMRVPMDIEAPGPSSPKRHGAKPDEEESPDCLAGLFDDDGNVPAKHEDARRPGGKQHRVTQRESERDANRLGVPRLVSRRSGGQGRNRHEMISAETVKESEGEDRDAQHETRIITRF
jgi:hypothetical protein